MKAIVFRGSSSTPALEDVSLADPGPGEVRVRIAAAGVCGSDVHLRSGDWDHPLPVVMGHEGSGIVTAVGSGVSSPSTGDHVVLAWVAPCGTCRHCQSGREARCSAVAQTVAANGVLHDGTSRLSQNGEAVHHYLGVSSFAEEVVLPAAGAIPVRRDAPLDAIALVGCAVATGVGAVLNTARVEAGSTVVVIGCGGVGLNVVQGARLAGAAEIIAVDLRPDKVEKARELGATHAIHSAMLSRDVTLAAAVRAIAPDGVDYAFDAIGATATTEQAVDLLGLGGTAVIVGLPPQGTSARFDPLVLAESEQRIVGSNYGSIRPAVDIPKLVDLVMTGELQLEPLISSRRPLAEAEAALADLRAGAALRTLLVPQEALTSQAPAP